MNYIEIEEKVEYLYSLIKDGYRASPKEFACKLQIPLRTFYRILDIIKIKYGEVEYIRSSSKYIFVKESVY